MVILGLLLLYPSAWLIFPDTIPGMKIVSKLSFSSPPAPQQLVAVQRLLKVCAFLLLTAGFEYLHHFAKSVYSLLSKSGARKLISKWL